MFLEYSKSPNTKAEALGSRVQGLGFRFQALGFRV